MITALLDVIFTPGRLKDLRQRLSLNQSQLADRIGVRPATVSRWEAGKLNISPSPQVLQRLLEAEREAEEKGA